MSRADEVAEVLTEFKVGDLVRLKESRRLSISQAGYLRLYLSSEERQHLLSGGTVTIEHVWGGNTWRIVRFPNGKAFAIPVLPGFFELVEEHVHDGGGEDQHGPDRGLQTKP